MIAERRREDESGLRRGRMPSWYQTRVWYQDFQVTSRPYQYQLRQPWELPTTVLVAQEALPASS